jgi:hypothetical protein
MGKKKSVAVRPLKVGDRVHLVDLESWGICEIITVHDRDEGFRYSARIISTEGHTSIHHIRPEKLRLADDDPGSEIAKDEKGC